MKPKSCSHEQSIIAAVQTKRWTDALRMHLASCTPCQETFQVAGYMHSLAAVEDEAHRRTAHPRKAQVSRLIPSGENER